MNCQDDDDREQDLTQEDQISKILWRVSSRFQERLLQHSQQDWWYFWYESVEVSAKRVLKVAHFFAEYQKWDSSLQRKINYMNLEFWWAAFCDDCSCFV